MSLALACAAPVCAPKAAQASEVCGAKQRKTDLYQAIVSCSDTRSVREATELGEGLERLLLPLGATSYCKWSPQSHATRAGASKSASNSALCQDPAGTLCSAGGKVLDANCHFEPQDEEESSQTPEAVEMICKIQASQSKFLATKFAECSPGEMRADCLGRLRIKYARELGQIETRAVYTPERIARVQTLFDQVKKTTVEMIRESKLIAPERKKEVLERLEKTRLAKSEDDFALAGLPGCYELGPEGPSSAIFNAPLSVDRPTEYRLVHFCWGAMLHFDRVHPAESAHSIAHELGHSIDPCSVERIFGDPKAGLTTYPGLVRCLRGGQGEDGCVGSVLDCGAYLTKEKYCGDLSIQYKDWVGEAKELFPCLKRLSEEPSCVFRVPRSFTKGKRDQIAEAFSDFVGAEVVARMATEWRPEDILLAIGATQTRLHGKCVTENILDEHPAGFIRINRIIMGSRRFREAAGCPADQPARTREAGVTCGGF